MFSSLDIRLQHIENQLTSQNNNWQHVETTLKAQNDTLQTQNSRMLKLEQQMSDLNTLKQTVFFLYTKFGTVNRQRCERCKQENE